MRRRQGQSLVLALIGFSPVAGIHLIATLRATALRARKECFSPVAGIHLIATASDVLLSMKHSRVSVPLPGFI